MPFLQSHPHVVVALPHSPQWDDRSTSSVIATTNRLLLLPTDKACWLAAYMCCSRFSHQPNELSRPNQDKLGQLSRVAKGLLVCRHRLLALRRQLLNFLFHFATSAVRGVLGDILSSISSTVDLLAPGSAATVVGSAGRVRRRRREADRRLCLSTPAESDWVLTLPDHAHLS